MKIQTKLIITFAVLGLCLMLLAVWLMQVSFDRGMVGYINQRQVQEHQVLAERLADYYQQYNGWGNFRYEPRDFHQIMRQFYSSNESSALISKPKRLRPERRPPPHHDRPSKRDRPLSSKRKKGSRNLDIGLLDENKNLVLGPPLNKLEQFSLLPIEVNQQIVGYLSIPKILSASETLDLSFIQQQRKQFLLIALLITFIAIGIALLLAQHFVKPIKQLVNLSREVGEGNLSARIHLARGDELGELSRQLNTMIEKLEGAEKSRRRWVADFSHELRTPLAILRGEIEAILDGVRDTSRKNIQSLHEEAQHLQKLIEDLYQLSSADAGEMQYQKSSINLVTIFEQQMNHHEERFKQKDIRLTFSTKIKEANLYADETRIQQLLDNVLNNSFKYTDDGGLIKVYLDKDKTHYLIHINDSKPGVNDSDLSKLFDYLYRTESSRNRLTGGSGLGLAICERIVAAHNGVIEASHSSLGGLSISIKLPLA